MGSKVSENSHKTVIPVEEITLNFGSVTALNHVNFTIREGEILAVIGPNGAGKTSALNWFSGFYKPKGGGKNESHDS